jgi:hypothetical protein
LRIPKKIKAFGREYAVVRDTHFADKVECWGYLDLLTDEILMKKRSTDAFTMTREKQVFMHELIHIIDDNLKLGLDEPQTQRLAVGIVTIIIDNRLDFNDPS